MNGSSWLILALLVVAMLSYLSPNWMRELQSRLADLVSPKGESIVERLKAATVWEEGKSEELQKVLEAKRELMIARTANIKLRKEIDSVSETSVSTEAKPAPPKERRR